MFSCLDMTNRQGTPDGSRAGQGRSKKIKEKCFMKIRVSQILFGAGVVLAMGILPAQELRVAHFKGQINDYSPANVAGGPYEMRGSWALDVQKGGVANFTADINMATSDYGISGATAVDPNNPATRGQHTHHIIVTNATVSYDTSACPAFSPATTGSGIVITSSPATTSGNGGPASFESKGASTLQICITGGTEVEFSNFTMVYTGPATGHFGTQAIHGVVTSVSSK
jgi:hypothetical protein